MNLPLINTLRADDASYLPQNQDETSKNKGDQSGAEKDEENNSK